MASFENINFNLAEEKDMLHKALIMAFPYWKKQYPSISLETEGRKIVLVDYRKTLKIVWERRPNRFFQQIRSAGFFQ